MHRPWIPEHEVTPELARQLIEAQFPDLTPVTVESAGVGWDNAAYRVNGRWLFRFPQRALAGPLIEHEIAVLPALAPWLPVPVPAPVFAGRPAGGYPYAFAGAAWIDGATACAVEWTSARRAANAAPLARFLAALHSLSVDVVPNPPGDDLRRADIRGRAGFLRDGLREVAGQLPPLGFDLRAAERLVDHLSDAPPAARDRWVHGDLYARHLLVDADLRLSGIIDWGDVHIGDPALDLSIAWSFLPAYAHAEFRGVYGAIDDAAWARARFRALHYGVILVRYGADTGDAAIQALGEYALRNTAESL